MDEKIGDEKPKSKIAAIKNLATTVIAGTPPPEVANTPAPNWVNQVAMLTGALAALAGFLTVRMTTLTNQAIYESNQAILSQTQSSDAWAEYQSDSIKARIVEMQMLPSSTLSAADKATLAAADKELRDRQPVTKKTAEDKAALRDAHLKNGTKNLGDKDLLGYASMAAQLSIALASAAALIRKRSLFHIAAGVGAVAIALTAYTFIEGLILNH